eukprot:751264-Hanusia_phi.AAC.1
MIKGRESGCGREEPPLYASSFNVGDVEVGEERKTLELTERELDDIGVYPHDVIVLLADKEETVCHFPPSAADARKQRKAQLTSWRLIEESIPARAGGVRDFVAPSEGQKSLTVSQPCRLGQRTRFILPQLSLSPHPSLSLYLAGSAEGRRR